jgi:C4-type Zn-finger protein
MKVVDKCPICGNEFTYDPYYDYTLLSVVAGEINKVIAICNKCKIKEDEIDQQKAESVE